VLRNGLAFLTGVLLFHYGPTSPTVGALALALILGIGLLWHPLSRLPGVVLLGFCWAGVHDAVYTPPPWPSAWEGADLSVRGRVAAIPEVRVDGSLRFALAVEQVSHQDQALSWNGRIRLTWYEGAPALTPGQPWQLRVRLKAPRGFANPGGFDYGAYLRREGFSAAGYVRDAPDNRPLGPVSGYGLARLRHRLAQRLQDLLRHSDMAGLVVALAVGDRSAMSDAHWQVLRATGTNHLMAISGLHIGLIAGLVFGLGLHLSRWLGQGRGPPAPLIAAGLAIAAALFYAALAGFSLPTQRALLMSAVALGAIVLRRPVRPWAAWGLALLAVLAWHPAAVQDASFWLSFVAVAWILWFARGRTGRQSPWRTWWSVQWVLFLGLTPVALIWFGQASLVSVLGNWVAVPIVGFLVVPVILLGVALLPVSGGAGAGLIAAGAWVLERLWSYLNGLAELPFALWQPGDADLFVSGLALIGALFLTRPLATSQRWIAGLLLLPALLGRTPEPVEAGGMEFYLLDVGQGLAAVIRTRDHVLVYDTGPRFRSGRDTGELVLLPFLRRQGVRAVDRLILSHGDTDHVGGARSLLRALPVYSLWLGEADSAPREQYRRCVQGAHWTWDGVAFQVLHPPRERRGEGNNQSCVLLVEAGEHRFLVAGDLEAKGERELLSHWGQRLRAQVLVAPHHGSATSSTPAFVSGVGARHVLFAVGYRNRWGFPKPAVVARYRKVGAAIWATDRDGAIRLRATPGEPLRVQAYRQGGGSGGAPVKSSMMQPDFGLSPR
jgi:competence protein ComEC